MEEELKISIDIMRKEKEKILLNMRDKETINYIIVNTIY